MIEFYLPFPPTVNNYYVKTSRGVFISQKGRLYRAGCAESLLEQVGGSDRDSTGVYDGRLHVEVVLAPPDKRKRDLDNYMKALLDAISITGLVWEDDSQIDQLAIFRSQVLYGGQVKVVVNLAGPLVPLDYHS